jgi:hypothetical protein
MAGADLVVAWDVPLDAPWIIITDLILVSTHGRHGANATGRSPVQQR